MVLQYFQVPPILSLECFWGKNLIIFYTYVFYIYNNKVQLNNLNVYKFQEGMLFLRKLELIQKRSRMMIGPSY